MALLPILEFPDPRLRTRARPVQTFDATLEQLVADMLQTMYAAPGVGLAGTQVDVHRQIIVMDTSVEKNDPQVYINAEILEREGSEVGEEGCLSVPNVFEPVKRATRVRARAQGVRGQLFERELTGLAAVCLQHELDHLAGKLFVDYLSMLKRERIRRKLEKERRERASGAGKPAAKPAAQPPAHAAGRVI
ncbi:MAG TPA: peptide deformylase [Steroidobacteraceae bacterium]|nr:peptide deformylase [Steroidobacteraceae bacterium]